MLHIYNFFLLNLSLTHTQFTIKQASKAKIISAYYIYFSFILSTKR